VRRAITIPISIIMLLATINIDASYASTLPQASQGLAQNLSKLILPNSANIIDQSKFNLVIKKFNKTYNLKTTVTTKWSIEIKNGNSSYCVYMNYEAIDPQFEKATSVVQLKKISSKLKYISQEGTCRAPLMGIYNAIHSTLPYEIKSSYSGFINPGYDSEKWVAIKVFNPSFIKYVASTPMNISFISSQGVILGIDSRSFLTLAPRSYGWVVANYSPSSDNTSSESQILDSVQVDETGNVFASQISSDNMPIVSKTYLDNSGSGQITIQNGNEYLYPSNVSLVFLDSNGNPIYAEDGGTNSILIPNSNATISWSSGVGFFGTPPSTATTIFSSLVPELCQEGNVNVDSYVDFSSKCFY